LVPHPLHAPSCAGHRGHGAEPRSRQEAGDPRPPHADPSADPDTTTYKQIPITTPARTLLDLAPTLEPRQLEQALAEALRRRLTRPQALRSLLARHSGRPGVPALRRLLESDAPAFTRSELEERFLTLVREAGLPAPEVNAKLGPYEVDFLWRDERLVVEVDGWDFHSDRKAFEEDRRRDAELTARGYRVSRVTWRQIADEPIAVIARVAAALAAATP
jgi:very-short-patch-repair endonuclease